MNTAHSQCAACAHLDREHIAEQHCDAFPAGIPDEIWLNRVSHTTGYPGDHGIHLDLIPLEQYRGPAAHA